GAGVEPGGTAEPGGADVDARGDQVRLVQVAAEDRAVGAEGSDLVGDVLGCHVQRDRALGEQLTQSGAGGRVDIDGHEREPADVAARRGCLGPGRGPDGEGADRRCPGGEVVRRGEDDGGDVVVGCGGQVGVDVADRWSVHDDGLAGHVEPVVGVRGTLSDVDQLQVLTAV